MILITKERFLDAFPTYIKLFENFDKFQKIIIFSKNAPLATRIHSQIPPPSPKIFGPADNFCTKTRFTPYKKK